MGTVVPPLYRIVTKSWLSGQSISSVSSSNNNPLDTRLWGWTKKKDCGLLPGNQTENTHEFMQLFFIPMQKYPTYICRQSAIV